MHVCEPSCALKRRALARAAGELLSDAGGWRRMRLQRNHHRQYNRASAHAAAERLGHLHIPPDPNLS